MELYTGMPVLLKASRHTVLANWEIGVLADFM